MRFRQGFGKTNFVWLGDRADVLADMVAQFLFQRWCRLDATFQGDECDHALAFKLGSLGHAWLALRSVAGIFPHEQASQS